MYKILIYCFFVFVYLVFSVVDGSKRRVENKDDNGTLDVSLLIYFYLMLLKKKIYK